MTERRWWGLWRGGRQGGREAGQRWRGRGGCRGGRQGQPRPRSSSFSLPWRSPKPTWRSPSHRPGGELLLFSPLTFFCGGVALFLTLYFLGSKIWPSSPSPTPSLILAYRGSDLHSWPKSRPNRPFSFRNANLDFNFLHFLPNAQIGEHKYPFRRIYPKLIALVTNIQKQQLYSYNT